MMGDFTIGQLAERVTGGNEAAIRKLLRDAGADLDELRQDPEETVSREVVIDLVAMRAGDRVGRMCAEVLHGAQLLDAAEVIERLVTMGEGA